MSTETTARDFTLTWTLDASPDEVFAAWTDPEQLEWFYNDSQPLPEEPIELDLQVGGEWRQHMIVDEKTRYVTGGVYREIVPGERLVFSWGAVGGWPALDLERLEDGPLVSVDLRDVGGRTRMTVHVELPAPFVTSAQALGWLVHVEAGMRDTVDRLAARLGTAAPA